MEQDWNSWGPLGLSMAGAVVGVTWAILRVWRMQRSVASQRNRVTARRFALGFVVAALVWLAWSMLAGYGRWLQPGVDRAWLLAVHAHTLWSIPLFISAVAWAASVALGWVFRQLQREESDQR